MVATEIMGKMAPTGKIHLCQVRKVRQAGRGSEAFVEKKGKQVLRVLPEKIACRSQVPLVRRACLAMFS
jgi:hypothetical protein